MDKEDKDSMKIIVIILIVLSALVFVGYNHFHPTREEQAQKAMLKLQKAFKEKMQDEIIQAAENLGQKTQENKSKNERKLQQESSRQVIAETHHANDSLVISESPQTKSERPILKSQKVDQVDNSLKQDSQVKSAAVTVFGITVGKTTEKEIRNRFTIIEEQSVPFSDNYKLLLLNKQDFSSEKLPIQYINVCVDQDGVVVQCLITFVGKHFKELQEVLSQKYNLKSKDDPFVGDRFALYAKNEVNIKLAEPHLGYITQLVYIKKELDALFQDYVKKQAEQENKLMAEQF